MDIFTTKYRCDGGYDNTKVGTYYVELSGTYTPSDGHDELNTSKVFEVIVNDEDDPVISITDPDDKTNIVNTGVSVMVIAVILLVIVILLLLKRKAKNE